MNKKLTDMSEFDILISNIQIDWKLFHCSNIKDKSRIEKFLKDRNINNGLEFGEYYNNYSPFSESWKDFIDGKY
jgi:hypothetical protein